MGIEWTSSAAKWGISQKDALYSIQNAIYTSTKVKVNSGELNAARRVFIGPQHGQTDRLVEVLVEMVGSSFVVYHVMPLGPYYRKQMEEDQ